MTTIGRPLAAGEQQELIDKLLACPTLNDYEARASLVSYLPDHIKHTIQLSPKDTAKRQVASIVKSCLYFPEELDPLIHWVGYFDKDTIPFRDLENFLTTLSNTSSQKPIINNINYVSELNYTESYSDHFQVNTEPSFSEEEQSEDSDISWNEEFPDGTEETTIQSMYSEEEYVPLLTKVFSLIRGFWNFFYYQVFIPISEQSVEFLIILALIIAAIVFVILNVVLKPDIGNETLTDHSSFVNAIAISPDGSTIVSGSSDKSIIFWAKSISWSTKIKLNTSSSVLSIAFSIDGKMAALGYSDGTIMLVDVNRGEQAGQSLTGHSGPVRSLAFSIDGKTLASAGDDKTIRLWNYSASQLIGQPITGHTDVINSLAFNRDGHTLASASNDKTIRLWDVTTGKSIGQPLVGHTGAVKTVAFSPNGKLLASGGDDNNVLLWNNYTNQPQFKKLTGHTDAVLAVAFSNDGKTLASGGDDRTILLWDTSTGTKKQTTLTGHTGSITSLAYSPTSNVLVSASLDTTIRVWTFNKDSYP